MDKLKLYTIANKSLLFIEYYWKQILIIILAVALIFSVKSCRNNKDQVSDLKAQQKWESRKYDSLVNVAGKKVIQAPVVVTTDEKFIKEESDKAFNLKKKDAKKIGKIKVSSEIDHSFEIDGEVLSYDHPKSLIYADTGNWVSSGDTSTYYIQEYKYECDSCFKVGDTFSKSDSTYDMKVELVVEDGKRGIKIVSLVAKDSIQWRLAETKRKLFKPPNTIVQITNTNPKFKLTGTRTMMVKSKVSVWHRWVKPTLVGIGVGFLTYKAVK